MLELEWREAARVDLLSIVEYIAQDNLDAALALVTEIDSACLARCTDVAARTPLMECCSSDWMLDSNYSTNSIQQGPRTNWPARSRRLLHSPP